MGQAYAPLVRRIYNAQCGNRKWYSVSEVNVTCILHFVSTWALFDLTLHHKVYHETFHILFPIIGTYIRYLYVNPICMLTSWIQCYFKVIISLSLHYKGNFTVILKAHTIVDIEPSVEEEYFLKIQCSWVGNIAVDTARIVSGFSFSIDTFVAWNTHSNLIHRTSFPLCDFSSK